MVRISLLALAFLTPILAHDISPTARYTITGDTVCAPTRNGTQVCYPKAFAPTAEFQIILPGQDIPAGLHIQIDMQTGLKKAKLPEDDNSLHNAVAVIPDDPLEDVQNKQDLLREGSRRQPQHQLEDELQLRLESIVMLADRQMAYVSEDSAIEALEELEDLVHDTRRAEQLARDIQAIPALLTLASPALHRGLPPWSPRTRQLAATVLGSTVQNNPKLQALAVTANVIPHLLRSLAAESDPKAASKHIYALSALVRGHAGALEQFTNQGGLRTLAMVHPQNAGKDAHRLEIRVARFVEDLFNPEFNPKQSKDAEDLVAQQAGVWCTDLAKRLTDDMESLDDNSERLATDERRTAYALALLRIKNQHPLTCTLPSALRPWVRTESAR
ncbi:nucleotide exchange factor sil1, partial [Linderina macrospora]